MTDLFDVLAPTVQERFDTFHRLHPEVFTMLVKLARQVKAAGMPKCGISLLWERLRWYWTFERRGEEEFKLNNVYRSRYVRLMIETYPDEFTGFFELRKLKST